MKEFMNEEKELVKKKRGELAKKNGVEGQAASLAARVLGFYSPLLDSNNRGSTAWKVILSLNESRFSIDHDDFPHPK